MTRRLFLALLLLGAPAIASAQKLVIVVRHAERADGGAGTSMTGAPADPLLSAAGEARAAKLAAMLADSGITAIMVTEFRRTQDTAKPIAAKLGLTPEVVKAADTPDLLSRLKTKHVNDVVLVVGHSNTIPAIIKAFTGRDLKVADSEYDDLFFVVPASGAVSRIKYAPAQTASPSTADLVRVWDAEHVSPPLSPLVDHAEIKRRIEALKASVEREGDGSVLRVREVGRSVEGREIWDVAFGTGSFVVMMWSQMHGDEASATSALFDLYEYLQRHRSEALVRQMLSALTVHSMPMLNPDGAERWQRRNVQALDLNRDALLLQSPEGQLLKKLRDELNPRVGFNLHNQSWNTTVGRPPRPASISLLSVAYDEARTVNEGRLLTKRLAAVVRDALEPLAGDRIGRYDDSFEVRAFGDNLTKWGTPVLLIETGPWPEPNPDPPLVRLNFVALVRALAALADGSVASADPARYDSLPENESQGFYYLIKNVAILVSAGVAPFTGDVGISASRRVRIVEGERRLMLVSSIADVGDLRTYSGLFEIDGAGRTVAPLVAGAEPGAIIGLESVAGAIQPGNPADLMLLKPDGKNFRVDRIFRSQDEIK
jgi:broad specificity phosphatase PhoE